MIINMRRSFIYLRLSNLAFAAFVTGFHLEEISRTLTARVRSKRIGICLRNALTFALRLPEIKITAATFKKAATKELRTHA